MLVTIYDNKVKFAKNMYNFTDHGFEQELKQAFFKKNSGIKGEIFVYSNQMHPSFRAALEKEHSCIVPSCVKVFFTGDQNEKQFLVGSYKRSVKIVSIEKDLVRVKIDGKKNSNFLNLRISPAERTGLQLKNKLIKEKLLFKYGFEVADIYTEFFFKIWVSVIAVSNFKRISPPKFKSYTSYAIYFEDVVEKSVVIEHEIDFCNLSEKLIEQIDPTSKEYAEIVANARNRNPLFKREKMHVEFCDNHIVKVTKNIFDKELSESKTFSYEKSDWELQLRKIVKKFQYNDQDYRFVSNDNIVHKGGTAIDLAKLILKIDKKRRGLMKKKTLLKKN